MLLHFLFYLIVHFETEVLWEVIILYLVCGHLSEPQQDVHLVHDHPISLHFPPIVDGVGLVLGQVEGQVLLLCFLIMMIQLKLIFKLWVAATNLSIFGRYGTGSE